MTCKYCGLRDHRLHGCDPKTLRELVDGLRAEICLMETAAVGLLESDRAARAEIVTIKALLAQYGCRGQEVRAGSPDYTEFMTDVEKALGEPGS